MGSGHNSSALKSNSVVDQSVAVADEINEDASKLISPDKLSTDQLNSSVISQGQGITATHIPPVKKSQLGSRLNTLDLLFNSVARIEGEQAFILKVQELLKGLNKILEAKSAEFVVFNKETRMLMLEMLPE